MAEGDLFRGFSVRFSFKKRQHVKMLEKFEDRKLNGGKSKNQIIMDALEMYYDALENNGNTNANREITGKYLEERLVQFKQEMLLELLRSLVGGNMAGKTIAISVPGGEQETGNIADEKDANISEMPDIMSRIMDWSSN